MRRQPPFRVKRGKNLLTEEQFSERNSYDDRHKLYGMVL